MNGLNHFEAWNKVKSAVLSSGDVEAVEALRVLTRPPVPNPPGKMGRLGGCATQLANQVHKTGWERDWQVPRAHGVAMERLIHRMTLVLEAFLDVYEQAHLEELAGVRSRLPVSNGAAAAVVDELYQRSFCDECGDELLPDGGCLMCQTDS